MVWPTLGSRMAKEQNRTEQLSCWRNPTTQNSPQLQFIKTGVSWPHCTLFACLPYSVCVLACMFVMAVKIVGRSAVGAGDTDTDMMSDDDDDR